MFLSKIIFLTLFSTAIVSAVPHDQSKRNVFTGGQIIIDYWYEHCLTLPANVADYCGYSDIYLPNARGHRTVDQAVREFNQFDQLINSNPRCSEVLGIYLCFHYFPVSGCPHSDSSAYVSLPCKETCKAAKTEECVALARLRKADWKWPSHMNCDLLKSNSSGELCSYAKQGITHTYSSQEFVTTMVANLTTTTVSVASGETTTPVPVVPGPDIAVNEGK